jgi:formamidopyrimidine-DNA glycosylase
VPELPEVETVRQGLNQVTLNQPIMGGDVLLPRAIAHPFSLEQFWAAVTGCRITHWHRRGKYLLAALSHSTGAGAEPPVQAGSTPAAGWLGVHLRMSGQLLWEAHGEPLEKHCRVRFAFAQGQDLRFVDQRTFGQVWWVPPKTPPEQIMTGLTRLGPEPFSPDFRVDYMVSWLGDRLRPIKSALLDQALVAGIGNIYADEALFLSGIHPQTPCAALTLPQIESLHRSILEVLQAGIKSGGTTISTFRNVEGVNGHYGGVAWVYGRKGAPCRRCASPIERLKLAGRSAHFCPVCQPSPTPPIIP